MIRIDEIYNNTFWPWIERNSPGTRMFFCDPFGHTKPENLYNHGSDFIEESDYIFFHDQEPIQIDAHRALFDEVINRNLDMFPAAAGSIVVSEKGDHVQQLCDIYRWKSHYYFFHGWACLDWYRGYNHTFLFPHPRDRKMPSKTFMSPNRIVGGDRDHRVLFIYHCLKNNLQHNYISAPRICPYENIDILEISKKYCNTYPDIMQVLERANLPWLYQGEETQHMTSCWLGNFQEAMDSMIYVPTETVYFGNRTHITEKTFKPIAMGMPFIIVGAAGSLEYMREYGFQTFSGVWDESYDHETDDFLRLKKITQLLKDLDSMSDQEKQHLWNKLLPVIEHNWNHFYYGGFENILWIELQKMLGGLYV